MRLMIEFSLRLSNQLVCESMYNVHTVTSQTPDPRFRNFQAVSHLQTPAFILYYLENATWMSSWTPFLPQLCSRETRTKRTLAELSRDTDAETTEYLDNVGSSADWTTKNALHGPCCWLNLPKRAWRRLGTICRSLCWPEMPKKGVQLLVPVPSPHLSSWSGRYPKLLLLAS